MDRFRTLEKLLRLGVFAGVALLLLTPFVVTPQTIFPFIVGKALWARSIVEVVFALWAVLALARPRYRPPRSWLLVLLAAGLGVALLAALTGESPQRSLWSTYERMLGVVDGAHWLALAVVLVSMLRSGAAWRTLLGVATAVGALVSLLVVARYFELDIPFYGRLPERELPRLRGPFGNSTFLAGYMLINAMMALGLAMRSWFASSEPAAAAPAVAPPSGRRGRRRRKAPPEPRRPAAPRWFRVVPWLLAAGLHLWALALAGSVGGIIGLFAAVGFLALAGAFLARGRTRILAVVALALLMLAAASAGIRVTGSALPGAELPDTPALRALWLHIDRPSVQSRLAAWEAGIEGFAARPVLGWGPENFIVVFGRYATGYGAVAQPHDQAHNKVVEVAATTGAAGLAAWLALWIFALATVWRAAQRAETGDRMLALFVGAALVGHLVQIQFLFDTVTGTLQSVVLLGFVARLEAAAFPGSRLPRLPARLPGWWTAPFARNTVRAALGAAAVAAVAVAAAGLASNFAIYAAANVKHLPRTPWSWGAMAGGIEGFRPLANTWRWNLFDAIALEWPRMRAEDDARSRRLMEWVSREAEEAVRAEPGEWRIIRSLARMYDAAARTDPEFAPAARRFLLRSRELAPGRAVFPPPLRPPHSLTGRRLDDGRYELGWRWPAGAGYVTVTESRGPRHNRRVFHAYDPARTSWVLPEGRVPGPWLYRIKACRYPGECSASAEWPAAAPPDREPAPETTR